MKKIASLKQATGELKLGGGLIKGFSWGTITFRATDNNFDKYEIKETEKITKDANVFYKVGLMAESDDKNKKYNLLFFEEGRLIDKTYEDEDQDQ